jgi:hypothetical protein
LQPSLAISPMRSAMIRLDPTTGTFTSTHLSFIQLCLETRAYAAAEPILDNYIHSLPAKIPAAAREGFEYSVPCADVARSGEYIHQNSGHSDKVVLGDVQTYYVLGAMAYLGLRQFRKALHFLEHVLVIPSVNVANGLMLEAYKKWILLSCLVHGSVSSKTLFGCGWNDLIYDRLKPLRDQPIPMPCDRWRLRRRHTRRWLRRMRDWTISPSSRRRLTQVPRCGLR